MCADSIAKLKTDLNIVQFPKKKAHAPYANWWLVFGGIVALTLCTRFYKVTEPDHVCWDETHFGKMASWYINRTFFFDVHPPLGKMLIALSGSLTGYDGTYPFEKPGDKYNSTRYEGMRIFCTAIGATIGPMTYVTVFDLTHSVTAAALSALLIVLDVGLITLSQYILLDPLLFGAMSAAVMGAVKCSNRALAGESSTGWLLMTGASLAAAISVKFVGLFVVLLVGIMTARDLWEVLGDLARPAAVALYHLIHRFICLILWPALLYMLFFYIHLRVLNRSGNGDGFYSSGFQSQLIGNSLHNASMPREVALGAVITLKNHRTGGGYLHSHQHLYPEGLGARQQQITTYTHKDDNNKWLVKTYSEPREEGEEISNEEEDQNNSEIKLLRHGDLVVLEHVATRRNLHSHREPAPISKKLRQVTGYGENGTGDANDVWRVMFDGGAEGVALQAVTTRFRLVHYLQGCALATTTKQLPKWGFEQQEVGCTANLRDVNALWNVEDNVFERLPSVSFEVYAPGFLERFLESHAVMFQGNAGLKPKEGEVTSRPWQWPINYRGQFFSGGKQKIYLLGNPVIWWGNLVILAIFLVLLLFVLVRRQRAFADTDVRNGGLDKSLQACCWLFLGWFLHYAPFWAMGRVLYFHHYFPALIFNSMLSGILLSRLLDYLDHYGGSWLHHTFLGILLASLFASFIAFSPLSYGMDGPASSEPDSPMRALRWMDTWEF